MQKKPGENSHSHAHTTISSLSDSASSEAYRAINDRMHADMVIDATGDADVD
ncbi:hypothetical protein [Achromobacter sp. UMC46]|uniref:hypothetical protein n=1 Tax=Achromobacter sp. UMC46 TaxID=1862319 RepID=UPI0015FF4E3B|nr:hypothetical protein [Achromobacter sp. UMC46]